MQRARAPVPAWARGWAPESGQALELAQALAWEPVSALAQEPESGLG